MARVCFGPFFFFFCIFSDACVCVFLFKKGNHWRSLWQRTTVYEFVVYDSRTERQTNCGCVSKSCKKNYSVRVCVCVYGHYKKKVKQVEREEEDQKGNENKKKKEFGSSRSDRQCF